MEAGRATGASGNATVAMTGNRQAVEVIGMTATWWEPAQDLIGRTHTDWVELWRLLDAASHAALALSLATPLGASVDLAFAALDLGEAREELEWVRPELGDLPPERLGQLHVGDDVSDALGVLDTLVAAAVDRTIVLGDVGGTLEELGALGRVLGRLREAIEEFARAAT